MVEYKVGIGATDSPLDGRGVGFAVLRGDARFNMPDPEPLKTPGQMERIFPRAPLSRTVKTEADQLKALEAQINVTFHENQEPFAS